LNKFNATTLEAAAAGLGSQFEKPGRLTAHLTAAPAAQERSLQAAAAWERRSALRFADAAA
jgi:hypothetical protein